MDLDDLLARRLATQHLTGAPVDPLVVVRDAVAVQAQDAPLARWGIGMRSGQDDVAVRALLAAGRLVRTHVLRPTWHYVLPEDLRWLLALSQERIERSLAARHRQVGITEALLDRAFAEISEALAGGAALTRKQLHPLLPTSGYPAQGELVGHLLMVAELRGLICSGPPAGPQHTYVLLDEVVPAAPVPPREEMVRELTRRFLAGHGPATPRELARWAPVTQTEARAAMADLDLASAEVGDVRVWWDPTVRSAPHDGGTRRSADFEDEDPEDEDPEDPEDRARGRRDVIAGSTHPAVTSRNPGARRALLLGVFDEAFLTYLAPSYPRTPGHPWGDRPPSAAPSGGGPVICDLREVGVWKRRHVRAGTTRVELDLSPVVTADQREAIAAEAARLARFEGRELEFA